MVPIHHFSAHVLAELIRRQPASKQKTTFAWQVAVGPALARVTTVELAESVLTVRACDARWAREIERAAGTIHERLRLLLGRDSVVRLNITF